MTFYEQLSSQRACEVLNDAGIHLRPEQVSVERRDERWLVRLPENSIAWFAGSAGGRDVMNTERAVLKLLEERCSFAAPRVLWASPAGEVEVRRMVAGSSDVWKSYACILGSAEAGRAFGTSIGRMLAEQHLAIQSVDVEGWLPGTVNWPEPREWIRELLVQVTPDVELIAKANEVIARHESIVVAQSDFVLAHTDVGLHNIAIDAASFTANGIYDYASAAWADRHVDFRYLIFDDPSCNVLDAALAVYEPAVGRTLDRQRIILSNAACAVCYLAFRAGVADEERWCGRTLAEDLRWTDIAIQRVLN